MSSEDETLKEETIQTVPKGDNPWRDFLLFRKMITPVIIEIFFWIGSIIIVILGISYIYFNSEKYFGYYESIQVLIGWTIILVGPILWRVLCELMILFFRIYETLNDIKNGIWKK